MHCIGHALAKFALGYEAAFRLEPTPRIADLLGPSSHSAVWVAGPSWRPRPLRLSFFPPEPTTFFMAFGLDFF